MSNITYTKTEFSNEHGQAFMKSNKETSTIMIVSSSEFGVSVYTEAEYNFSQQSTEKEFDEAYLKAMLELGLLDCFQKLGFAMSPTVRQMTTSEWHERINKQTQP